MLKHHEDSIKIMIEHYKEDPEIIALFLVGSLVTGTERPDSDLDGVAIVSDECYEKKKNGKGTMETHWGKCTYDDGYFDIKFMTRKLLEEYAETGSEPNRNLFINAKVLYCDDPELPELAKKIPVFPEKTLENKQKRRYSTLKQAYTYFWVCCKPQGCYRYYIANIMVFNLYRLILLENRILFPSSRKLEETVERAENKPENIINICRRFMETLTDEDALSLVKIYEEWTSYDYPKDHAIVNNNYSDPYEWE